MQTNNKKTVLVVDDEELIRELLYDVLEGEYEVLLAEDGEQALKKYEINSSQIDAVITDLIMPRMRGDKLLEKLREKNPSLPVIIITGFEKEIDVIKILQEPKVAFIHKPFDIEQLLSQLESLM
ncbi:response regulator receiver protein [Chloroherpeton thalassium ATCC 35110]|uniref:Response regulator receiver protein n=1 Tax=Chloroherpeton thalassium (strain ATCC 35110 / GB-78) TaxID=517418 RepID=B3QWH7_CHLT3|nr:response regulator [Chloroherpeton thalassium]ACF14737.1 response regulator receiver protein [Chloroherpeton thalassium ATCC 35110]